MGACEPMKPILTKNLNKDFDTALTKGREKGTKQTTTCTTFATMARLRVGKRLSTRELEIQSLKRELQISVLVFYVLTDMLLRIFLAAPG